MAKKASAKKNVTKAKKTPTQKPMAAKKSEIGIIPLHDMVVVAPIEEAVSPGGIIIPDTVEQKSEQGVVVAVGPGKFDDGVREPMSVQKGDRVLFSKSYDEAKFKEVKLGTKSYYIVSESNILAVLN